jgi:hypothetical protein
MWFMWVRAGLVPPAFVFGTRVPRMVGLAVPMWQLPCNVLCWHAGRQGWLELE